MQDRVGKKWKVIQAIAELDYSVNDTIYGDSYFAGARFKFLEMGQLFSRAGKGWQPVATMGFLNELDDVCSCQRSIYITGQNSAAYPPIPYVGTAKGRVQETIRTPEEQQHLRCDSKGRLWLFSFRGIWEKAGKSFLKRY